MTVEQRLLDLRPMGVEPIHRQQVVVVVQSLRLRPLDLALPTPVQGAVFVGPVHQAELAVGVA